METEESSKQLVTDVIEAIDSVKDALTLVNTQQASLKEKARNVKNQIQDDVSLHLDLLRNREVWLLEQVDLFTQLKEESIESNQKDLCVLLAKLEIYLEFLQMKKFEKNVEAAVEVGKLLSGIQEKSLNVEESPEICVFVHNLALSEAIKNFGKITEELPAAQKKIPMATQPFSRAQDLFVQEHFNAVLNSPESEWLIPSSGPVNESKPYGDDEPATVDAVREFFAELKLADVNEWLRKEGQPVDLETTTNGFTLHFEKIKKTPNVDWVKPVDEAHANSKTLTVIRFDGSEKPDTWLLMPESFSEISKEESATDEKSPDNTVQSDISQQEKMEDDTADNSEWLLTANCVNENEKDHVMVEPMKLEENANSKIWLLSCEDLDSTDDKVIVEETGLQKFRKSVGKNARDWLMGSSIEPEYCEWLTRESINRCKNCPGVCAKDMLKVFNEVSGSPRNEWLVTAMDW